MDNTALKNLRDFLLQYNKISESCFLHCVNHLSDRDLSQDECGCVDMCTKKHVSVNHKVMQVYMEIQPQIINKRIEDMNKQQQLQESIQKKGLETSNQKSGLTDSEKAMKVESINESKQLMENKSNADVSKKDVLMRAGAQ